MKKIQYLLQITIAFLALGFLTTANARNVCTTVDLALDDIGSIAQITRTAITPDMESKEPMACLNKVNSDNYLAVVSRDSIVDAKGNVKTCEDFRDNYTCLYSFIKKAGAKDDENKIMIIYKK